jgi:hypothetical protein
MTFHRVNDLEDLIITELRLSVSRTWGHKILTAEQWKALSHTIFQRDNYTCVFCGIHSSKYLFCDHIDGNASHNDHANLRSICPLCELIRHCGRAGINGYLGLYSSQKSQIAIVQESLAYFRKHGKVPKFQDLDKDAVRISPGTTVFANVLLEKNYEELNEEEQTYRGFFTSKTYDLFSKLCKEE